MKALRRWGLVSLCAVTATAAAFGLVWFVVLHLDPGFVAQKLSLNKTHFITLAVVFAQFYCFMNDLLAHLSSKLRPLRDLGLSEFRITFDKDMGNDPIPLRSKLLALYPGSIAMFLLGSAMTFQGMTS